MLGHGSGYALKLAYTLTQTHCIVNKNMAYMPINMRMRRRQ